MAPRRHPPDSLQAPLVSHTECSSGKLQERFPPWDSESRQNPHPRSASRRFGSVRGESPSLGKRAHKVGVYVSRIE